jgi:hypothetical protein
MRPKDSAKAPVVDSPSNAIAAAATAVFCQRCDLAINLYASGAAHASGNYYAFFGQKAQLSKRKKYHNINVLA